MTQCYDFVIVGGGLVGSAIAEGLVAKGFSICLIDRGVSDVDQQIAASPAVKCTKRNHMGYLAARNHVLGGNGHFWGGGMIRPPGMELYQCLGLDSGDSESLATNFDNVERRLNIGPLPSRSPFILNGVVIDGCTLSGIVVLPGRKRNTATLALERFRHARACATYTSAKICSFSREKVDTGDCKIRTVTIQEESGSQKEILGKQFVICAGVIDTNLLLIKHADDLGLPAEMFELGARLHDHHSLPIAQIQLPNNRAIRDLIAPRFLNGNIIGRRFELNCESGYRAKGFLHFTMQFDEVSPYREIKALLLLRQQGASKGRLLKAGIPLIAKLPRLTKIALERIMRRRLFLSDNLSISATIDFESFPHRENYLRIAGEQAELSWDIYREDEESFLEILSKAKQLLAALARNYGLEAMPLIHGSSASCAIDYFRGCATDAYHLGGGIACDADGKGVVDANLRLCGVENMFVVSSAVFRRPGIVNPTHTLFALADRFVSQQK